MLTQWSVSNLNHKVQKYKLLFFICEFLYKLALKKKHINLKLHFGKNKNFCVKKSAVTSLLFKLLKQRLIDVTSFRLSRSLYSPSVLFKRNNNFVSVFPNLFDFGIYTHTSAFFFFPHCLFLVSILLFLRSSEPFFYLWLAVLSLYQSPVDYRSR